MSPTIALAPPIANGRVLATIAETAPRTGARLCGETVRDLARGRQPTEIVVVVSQQAEVLLKALNHRWPAADTVISPNASALWRANGEAQVVILSGATTTDAHGLYLDGVFLANEASLDFASGRIIASASALADIENGVWRLRQRRPPTSDIPQFSLRAIRVAASEPTFTLESTARDSIVDASLSLANAKGDQIGEEMNRLLGALHYRAGVATLMQLGVLDRLRLPNLTGRGAGASVKHSCHLLLVMQCLDAVAAQHAAAAERHLPLLRMILLTTGPPSALPALPDDRQRRIERADDYEAQMNALSLSFSSRGIFGFRARVVGSEWAARRHSLFGDSSCLGRQVREVAALLGRQKGLLVALLLAAEWCALRGGRPTAAQARALAALIGGALESTRATEMNVD